MKLYHGSNTQVEIPDLEFSNRKRDFGKGFYLTSSLEQAKSWAKHRTKISNQGHPIVTIYDLDDSCLNVLNVKTFKNANKEWLKFITNNRKSKENIDNQYDIIIGPVANDNTTPTINLYLTGIITSDIAIENLKTYVLKDQYVIKTDKALSYLKYKGVIDCD